MPKILNVICNTVLPIILAKKARPTAEVPNNRAEIGKDRFILKKKKELVALLLRIYHEYEGMIEKSVLRIAFWHHEACRVHTNGDSEGRILLSYPHTNNGFFFLLATIFFILK